MVKVSKTFSLDKDLINWLEEHDNNPSPSDICGKALKEYKNAHSVGTIKCSKCGAVYTELAKSCPQCDIENGKVQVVKSKLEEANARIDYLNRSKALHIERFKTDEDPVHLERIKEIEAKLKELVG